MPRRLIYLLVALLLIGAAVYPCRILLSLFTSKEYLLLETPLSVTENVPSAVNIRRLARPIRDDILVLMQRKAAVTRTRGTDDSFTELSWSDDLMSPIKVLIVDVEGTKHKMRSYGYSRKGALFYLPIREMKPWKRLEALEINSKTNLEITQIIWCDGNLL